MVSTVVIYPYGEVSLCVPGVAEVVQRWASSFGLLDDVLSWQVIESVFQVEVCQGVNGVVVVCVLQSFLKGVGAVRFSRTVLVFRQTVW